MKREQPDSSCKGCIFRSGGGSTCSEIKECLYCKDLYSPIHHVVETPSFVAAKLRQIEREMDYLSDKTKQSYLAALQQEIKQGTHYVRSTKFLMSFLRAESYDVSKAAVRLAKFFNYKLDLFGLEKLPHCIRQEDLNEDDKKVLASGFMHYQEADCGGRPVIFSQRERLRSLGLLNQHYVDNIKRVTFYCDMFAVEHNERFAKNGFVGVAWNVNSTLPLKEFRLLFISNIKMCAEALPLKVAALHHCYSHRFQRLCLAWSAALLPKSITYAINSIEMPTPHDLLNELSKYGVNVDTLPITKNGDFEPSVSRKRLDEMRDQEESAALMESDDDELVQYEECTSSNFQPKSDLCLSKPSVGKESTNFLAEEHLPLKLTEILEGGTASDAIWWSRDGTAVAIEKTKFQEKVLSKDFSGIKLDSFLRRLRRWGFKRLPKKKGTPRNSVEYEHKLFRKDSPELLKDWDNVAKKDRFPMRLMKVIENNASGSIWWVEDGKAFAVEKKKFSQDILEKHFEGLKFDSFLRMMRRWGFKRLSDHEESTSSVMVFHHALFQKDAQLSSDLLDNWNCLDSLAQLCAPKKKNQALTFPKKLYNVLSSDKARGASWWIDGGSAFAIDTEIFSHDVLSNEFGNIKFISFQRKMKRWGFKKLKSAGSTPHVSFYAHPLFKMNRPELLDEWGASENKSEAQETASVGQETASITQDGSSHCDDNSSICEESSQENTDQQDNFRIDCQENIPVESTTSALLFINSPKKEQVKSTEIVSDAPMVDDVRNFSTGNNFENLIQRVPPGSSSDTFYAQQRQNNIQNIMNNLPLWQLNNHPSTILAAQFAQQQAMQQVIRSRAAAAAAMDLHMTQSLQQRAYAELHQSMNNSQLLSTMNALQVNHPPMDIHVSAEILSQRELFYAKKD